MYTETYITDISVKGLANYLILLSKCIIDYINQYYKDKDFYKLNVYFQSIINKEFDSKDVLIFAANHLKAIVVKEHLVRIQLDPDSYLYDQSIDSLVRSITYGSPPFMMGNSLFIDSLTNACYDLELEL